MFDDDVDVVLMKAKCFFMLNQILECLQWFKKHEKMIEGKEKKDAVDDQNLRK